MTIKKKHDKIIKMTEEKVTSNKSVKEARKKAAVRIRGRNTELAAVCFLSDLGLIISVIILSVILSVEESENIRRYAIYVCFFSGLAVWIFLRALTGEFKRRAFNRVLKDKEEEKKTVSFGLYFTKYILVMLGACFLFIPAAAVNALYLNAENENGTLLQRMRQSRMRKKGFVKAAILMTVEGIYKILLPATAALGAVSICYKINITALRAIIAAISVLTVAAVIEFLYARYRLALLILDEAHKKKETEERNKLI